MEQNTLPPLVSDDDALTMARKEASNWRVGNQSDAVAGAEETILAVRAIYEQARKSDREVIQKLAKVIDHMMNDHPADTLANAKYYAEGGLTMFDALALAKSQCGIEPTKP